MEKLKTRMSKRTVSEEKGNRLNTENDLKIKLVQRLSQGSI